MAPDGGVIGIEDPSQRFGCEFLGDSADELTVAEDFEVEIIGRGGCPKPKRVDCPSAIADDRPIVWDADQRRRLADNGSKRTLSHLESAVQFYLHPLLVPGNLPGVSMEQPVVRLFLLPAIADRLLEDAIFNIANQSPSPAAVFANERPRRNSIER